MKIEIKQLYTALQYYKMLQKERLFIHPDEPDGGMSECADNWVHYGDYLRLLDQPLTKEMFVNPFKKPECYIQPCKSAYKEWQEAEKKVIFNMTEQYEDGDVFFEFGEQSYIYPVKNNLWCIGHDGDEKDIKTIHDLAEATNGQLTLKNVEI